MNAYIYCADIYCEECAAQIKRDLKSKGLRPVNYRDESTYDSDEYPKGPYENGGGESDSPEHCGNHARCLNAIVWPDGEKSGCFLENPLTQVGYEYVKQEHRDGKNEVTQLWADFYEIDTDTDTEEEESTMYELTLTQDERAAFDWVGDRYSTGDNISSILIDCLGEEQSWGDSGDITFLVPEHKAWEIMELAEQEDSLFPCFSDELRGKMLDFIDLIV